MNYGLYLHIPFCRKKCDYCSFYSIPLYDFEGNKDNIIQSYINKLIKDINIRLKEFSSDTIDTVYLGGGTPSILNANDVKRIFREIKNSIQIDAQAEITIEINPEDVSIEKLEGFRDTGVNRFVLGVQTCNQRVHAIIGRGSKICDEKIFNEFFSVKGIHGFDIITGIPGQEEYELDTDLHIISQYNPDHISGYMLSIDKNTPLYKRIKQNSLSETFQRDNFEKIISTLINQGYIHYEISNFSLPGSESQHNMKYWTFMPYIGIGPSAHSFYHNQRYYNNMSVKDYLTSDKIILQRDNRGVHAEIVEYILTRLRLIQGFSIHELEKRLAITLPEKIFKKIYNNERIGLIIIDTSQNDIRIRLSREGLFLADSVIYDIVEDML